MKTPYALTLALMLTALSGQLIDAQETATTASTHFVDIDGARVGYRTFGSGAPLLLLTRFRGTLDTWDPLFIDRLAEVHKVITVDYPGVGYSTPIQQAWLARALKPVNDLEDEEVLFVEPASESSRHAAKRSHDRIYARLGVTERIPATESAFQAYFKLSDQFKADASGRRDQLQKIGIPILVLSGDADPSVPAANWYPLTGRIPRAQLIVLPQSGHAPQHQFPALSAHYIGAFLRDEEPQQ